MAILCLCPPENSCGYFPKVFLSANPTFFNMSFNFSFALSYLYLDDEQVNLQNNILYVHSG